MTQTGRKKKTQTHKTAVYYSIMINNAEHIGLGKIMVVYKSINQPINYPW